MQKFPEDELTKRRHAMMSTETVLDYKKRVDDVKAEIEAKARMEEAEKWAKVEEALKSESKRFFDMHTLRHWPAEMMQHFVNFDAEFKSRTMGGRMEAYHQCPICEAEKRANFKSLPSLEYRSKIIGVDWAKKPARTVMVDFDPSSTELRIAAELQEKADKAVRDRVDRTFLDMLETYLPAGASLWPLPRDPMYEIEGTRRNMHDDFVRRMQRELRDAEPIMRVTCSDPSKSKADVWKAVKDFLDKTKRDRTAIPMLPADIKIEPIGPTDVWDRAREALKAIPPRSPMFYNEVLGEYHPQHAPGRVDALYKESVKTLRHEAKTTPFTMRGIRGNRIDFVAVDEAKDIPDDLLEAWKATAEFKHWENMIRTGLDVPKEQPLPADVRAMAQKFYAEGKISRATLMKYAGTEEVKDEQRSGDDVRLEGEGRDEEV